jgi:hypothetical protein
MINAPDDPGTAEEMRHFRSRYPHLRPGHVWMADLATEQPPAAMLNRLSALLGLDRS